jgi:hypothetical protein
MKMHRKGIIWLQARGMHRDDPQAAAALTNELPHQSTMLAFVDTVSMIALSFVLLAPLLLLIRYRRPDHAVQPTLH